VGYASDGHTEHYGTSIPAEHGHTGMDDGENHILREHRVEDAYDARGLPRANKPRNCPWGPGHCAEFKTIPPLLPHPAAPNSNKHIVALTANTHSGEPMPMCPNCKKYAQTVTNETPGLAITDLGDQRHNGPKTYHISTVSMR
jgi:hypothetical protein